MDSSQAVIVSTITGVVDEPQAAWNALVDEDDPFLEHAFLAALERVDAGFRTEGLLTAYVSVDRARTPTAASPWPWC